MELYKINIVPTGGFYTPIKGDTLFGMFCWTVAEIFGENRLTKLLNGYTENAPFIVLSDAFPSGYFPKPVLPFSYFKMLGDNKEPNAKERKKFKRREWVSADKISLPTNQMFSDEEISEDKELSFKEKSLKTANSVNPETNHASGGRYSAFTIDQLHYHGEWSIYAVMDETRITCEEIKQVFKQIGMTGYGKKASAGGGKFYVKDMIPESFKNQQVSALMTLAPCVPRPDEFDEKNSFYKIFVRFGKHGNIKAVSENPFKNPVLTMDTGAVLSPKSEIGKVPLFIGTGITNVSLIDDRTVFQGYAPVIGLTAKETVDE